MSGSAAELYEWVRREEQYATLGANVVVELNSESHARQPTARAWAIIRRADRSHRLVGQRASRPERRQADRAEPKANEPTARSGRWLTRCSLIPPDSTSPTASRGSRLFDLGFKSHGSHMAHRPPLGYELI